MADLEKVFDALRNCVTEPKCKDCPWEDCEKIGCKRTKVPVTLLLDALNLMKEQPKWISVKNDLPKEHDSIFANHTHLSKHMWAKESDNVIVYVRFPDGTGRSTEGRLQDGKWWTRVSPMLEPVVTHWMPLPEPPKEVKQDG